MSLILVGNKQMRTLLSLHCYAGTAKMSEFFTPPSYLISQNSLIIYIIDIF